MNTPAKIVIADDHPLFRGGLRQVIDGENSFEVVGEAADGETALRMICDLQPDAAILDINMPLLGGFEVVGEVRRRNLPTQIVILTMHSEEAMFNKAMSLGVRGYVLKDGAAHDIVQCLHAIRRGQSFTSAGVTNYLFKRASGFARPTSGINSLTPTERIVLRGIGEYKTSKEIARELGISFRTVENHRRNISVKLEINGSHALIKFAQQNSDEI
jgi:DNA-binding NarL/FixJ family response regulator